MKNNKGFTLVEIMIVVAIIALLATIAIPGLLRSRMSANESGAIGTIKSMATGAETFRSGHTPMVYPTNLAALTDATPPYVTGLDNTGLKAGYTFTLAGDTNQFEATADANANAGARNFCIDERGQLYSNPQATAYGVAAAGTQCTGTAVN